MEQNFRMIDVGEKQVTRRRALATGKITVCAETMKMIQSGQSPKGNILSIAEVAGILGAKNTPQLLPLCHHLALDSVRIWFEFEQQTVQAFCEVICHGKTGVEMEALVGVNTCLLTIYDLAKAVDPVIRISDVHLQVKEGGKSGVWTYPNSEMSHKKDIPKKITTEGMTSAVLTLSDRASQGIYEDLAGPLLQNYCRETGSQIAFSEIIPDDAKILRDKIQLAVENSVDFLLVTGGTGISPRDITPDVLYSMASRELMGFGELQRQYGSQFTKSSYLSRSSAYVVGSTLVVLFPGSPKAVKQGLEAVGDLIPHAVRMLKGETHHHSRPISQEISP